MRWNSNSTFFIIITIKAFTGHLYYSVYWETWGSANFVMFGSVSLNYCLLIWNQGTNILHGIKRKGNPQLPWPKLQVSPIWKTSHSNKVLILLQNKWKLVPYRNNSSSFFIIPKTTRRRKNMLKNIAPQVTHLLYSWIPRVYT